MPLRTLVPALLIALSAACAAPASVVAPPSQPALAAASDGRVAHRMIPKDEAALAREGFRISPYGTTFRTGGLHLDSGGFLTLDESRWFPAAGLPEGWAFEVRLGPIVEEPRGACTSVEVQVAVYDGHYRTWLRVSPGAILLSSTGDYARASPAADRPHLYRLERRGDRVRLSIDGESVAEVEPETGEFPLNVASNRPLKAVMVGAPWCAGARYDVLGLGYELALVAPSADPEWHPGAVPGRVLEALAESLPPEAARCVRGVPLSAAASACAARLALEDAVRVGARGALEALLKPPPPPPAPKDPPGDAVLVPTASPTLEPGCGGPAPLAQSEVEARTRAVLKQLDAMTSVRTPAERAAAKSVLLSPTQPEQEQEQRYRQMMQLPHPICDPAGPCDCRPPQWPSSPTPGEVGMAVRALDLAPSWRLNPENVYETMRAVSFTMRAPGAAERLADNVAAVASGARRCEGATR